MPSPYPKIGKAVGQVIAQNSDAWQRPADWLDMPDVQVGDEILHILVAVFPNDTNVVALKSLRNFEVDVGDGNGFIQCVGNSAYGFLLDYDDYAGTECSEGYRQAIVTMQAQAGNNLDTVYIDHTPNAGETSSIGHDPNYAYLDVKYALPYSTTVWLRGTSSNATIRRVHVVGPSADLSLTNRLTGLPGLQSVVLPATYGAGVLGMSSLYAGNKSMPNAPKIDTSSATLLNRLHHENYALRIAPDYDTSSVENASFMYYKSGLVEAPNHNFTSATNINNIFGYTAIPFVPTYDFSNVADAGNFIAYNLAVIKIAPQHMPQCQSLFNFARNTTSLRELTLSGLGNVADTGGAFFGSDSLSKLILGGLTVGFDIQYSNMGAQALNDLADSLGTAKDGSQIINIKTNPGALTCDYTKFTSKNYELIKS